MATPSRAANCVSTLQSRTRSEWCRAVIVRAGEHLEGLTWSASPKRPCICGRVTDEQGRPLPNVPVFAWFQSKAKGYIVLPGVSTDSAGNFDFLDLKPGGYFIWTDSSVFSPNGEVSV